MVVVLAKVVAENPGRVTTSDLVGGQKKVEAFDHVEDLGRLLLIEFSVV